MKILIADDHALMREGIQIVLSRLSSDIKLIEASNYEEVGQLISKHTDLDLVLVDLTMPGDDPFVELDRVIKAIPDIPVVVISASENPSDMRRVINAGAKGYIPKAGTNDILLAALELVLSGGVYLPTQLFDYEADCNKNESASSSPEHIHRDAAQSLLTRRQSEVINLLAMGQSNKEIGRSLGLSEGTVRTHVGAIFRILDVNNRTQAGVRARELGLLSKQH